MLSAEQISSFKDKGYVLIPDLIPQDLIQRLRDELQGWIEESRAHSKNYGKTLDGKARFDLEPGHSAAHPKLRRVANPVDVSEAYQEVLWNSDLPRAVSDVFGQGVKFHHCKLNIKLPGMKTRVEYHQDHPYDPHTNNDMLTALVLLDDMTAENGCLRVVPGSHKHRYSHYRDGKFVGKVSDELNDEFARSADPILGKAGDVCLMDTWSAHGGEDNHSGRPRSLLICDYTAADNFWIAPPMVPSPHSGRIVHGEASRVVRLEAGTIEIPDRYKDDSFFGLQGQGNIAN